MHGAANMVLSFCYSLVLQIAANEQATWQIQTGDHRSQLCIVNDSGVNRSHQLGLSLRHNHCGTSGLQKNV